MIIKKPNFFITNISAKKDIRLTDLNLTIRSMTTVDLYALKGITPEQINKSLESGDLFKKSAVIKVRNVAPVKNRTKLEVSDQAMQTRREISKVIVEEQIFDELQITDEELAAEFSDGPDEDQAGKH